MSLRLDGIRRDVPLAPYTTLGLGGPAEYFLEATTLDGLRAALVGARDARLPVLVLGGGSNLVLPDEGVRGLVVHLALAGLAWEPEGDTVRLRAAAGEPWDPLVAVAVAQGHGGFECLSGIPGLVGGTPIQNVGAYGQEVAEVIEAVEVLDRRTLEAATLAPDACGFGYRTSRFKHADAGRYVVTAVTFRLARAGRPDIRYPELADAMARRGAQPAEGPDAMLAVREAVLALRRRKGMVLDPTDTDTRSAGSFFTNPVLPPEEFARLEAAWRAAGHDDAVPRFPAPGGLKVPAAWLVERAGFAKGLTRDGVGISTKHALALVNRGGSTAALLALVEEIRAGVRARFGVGLEPEPVIVD